MASARDRKSSERTPTGTGIERTPTKLANSAHNESSLPEEYDTDTGHMNDLFGPA
jgi:hypothetical protein